MSLCQMQYFVFQEIRRCRRFTKYEDEMILAEVAKVNGRINDVLDTLVVFFMRRHSRRSIRDRYVDFLSRRQDEWSKEEDEKILNGFKDYGAKWSRISNLLQCRSATQVKIRYRQLSKMNVPRKKRTQKPKLVESNKETSIYNIDSLPDLEFDEFKYFYC